MSTNPTIPITFASPNWYTIKYIAAKMNRSRRTVQYWVQNGLFARMGITVITIPAKRYCGRSLTWVYIPNNRKYAMFNRVHLDSLNKDKIGSN